ncbi:prosaposin-like [Takifugu flavidus]|uniref:Prosaposin Proactivator polypeptide n=1 Tax=Takifugu flavidus TaxID=433684 RepID=A0A5C6NET6_9TELE|nr:prosaposin-like [Takifugu flavidus]TWW66022.1 hypothetical protein D4764_20G0000540 [Takifugu flavidus]
MALLKRALLLYICLEASAVTLALNPEGLRTVLDSPAANGDVCQDCTQIFELLSDLLSNTDLQKKVMDGIENLCTHLPGTPAKLCKDEVEKLFPVAVTFLTTVMKPSEICKAIGLCKGCERLQIMLRYLKNEALQAAAGQENVQTEQCSFCLLLVKTLENLLPKERTEGAVIDLLEEVCNILPASYRSQCQALVGKFSKTVLDAILSYATPQAICALLQMCKGQEAPLLDPCTLPAYRCRDIKTAVKCGTVFYCQKFAWKYASNTF